MIQQSFFGDAWKLRMDADAPVIDRDPIEEAYKRWQEREAADRAKEKRDREEQERRYRQAREERQREAKRAQDEANARARERARYRASSSNAGDPWMVLGVAVGASKAEIRAAWVRLVKQHHPDTGGDAAKFREVQAAYERLK